MLPPRDFKSLASTNFATRAYLRWAFKLILNVMFLPAFQAGLGVGESGGAGRNRTDDGGVAVHSISTLLPRLINFF